ncbi:hypothetical protein BGX29_007589 [Mortierella sp. GBA35]|nr:hypothetical protein BGX29_007589 [Mortierella sp. GBA35]
MSLIMELLCTFLEGQKPDAIYNGKTKYKVLDELRRRGFGTVYRIEVESRQVALKASHGNEKWKRDFLENEMAMHPKLHHPRVVEVFDSFKSLVLAIDNS